MAESPKKSGFTTGLLALLSILSIGVAGAGSLQVTQNIEKSARSLGVRELSEKEKEQRQKDYAAALAQLSTIKDYDAARWHPLHFPPQIDTATNDQCLACHKEVLTTGVRKAAPAGVTAAKSIAWYQTLDTYTGEQLSFHARHLTSDYSKQVMNLSCTLCHQGHDPREEAPGSSASTVNVGKVAMRKQVDPTATCLMCHGKFPAEYMAGLEGPWHKQRENFESEEQPNGCLTCHAEQFRTVRHKVNYLKADNIEALAKKSGDVCFGCHGGRAWYRTSYPYPRHPWPDMPTDLPDWAVGRPTASDPRHTAKAK